MLSFSAVRWTDQEIHFIDFEGARSCGILEYGVVTLRAGEILQTRTRLCSPTGRLRPEDTAVHGLGEEALAGARPFADDWDLFAGLRTTGPFAAHYAGVENALIKSVWPYPRISPDFARPGGRLADWGPWIDSAALCLQIRPAGGSGRLEAVIAGLGLQSRLDSLAASACPSARRAYHAALYDALAGALILLALGQDPGLAGLGLTQILALSTRNPERRNAIIQQDLFD